MWTAKALKFLFFLPCCFLVTVKKGTDVRLKCQSKQDIEECSFRSPDGKDYKYSEEMNMKGGLITSLSETEKYDKSKTCGILLKKISDADLGNWSCEVKSKAGVEAIVLPVEFPEAQVSGGSQGKDQRNLGKDQRDWTGIEKMKLIDKIPQWGPFYRLSFDLFLNSLPLNFENGHRTKAISIVLQLAQNWHEGKGYITFDLYQTKGKPVMKVMAPGFSGWYYEKKRIEVKKWIKIELERRQLEKKDWEYERKRNAPVYIMNSYLSLKINGEEVKGQRTNSYAGNDKPYKNVSLLSGNDHSQDRMVTYIPDIKIKNLKHENFLKNPEYVPHGIWREKSQ